MTDLAGHLVEYIDKNRLLLGLVQSVKKNKLSLLTSGDRQVALPQNRVLFSCLSAISPEKPRDEQLEYLKSAEQRREDLAGLVDVTELWELVHEETDPVPLADLAELHFGAPLADDHVSATLRALFNERLHFKLAGGEFIPLTQEQLEKKLEQQAKEEANRDEVDRAVAYLKAFTQNGAEAGEPPEGLVDLLKNLVIFEEDAPLAKKAKEIISLAEVGGRPKLFGLLVKMGVFGPHENLALLRERLPVEFRDGLASHSTTLDLVPSLNDGREDLTGLYTFTIDGLYTTDFDDALSFEPAPDGGGTLGIHITDAAALITSGDPLDEEAMDRGTTLYMADDRVPMLPPALSEDKLSLRQGQKRPAISCLAELAPDGAVKSFSLHRSVVQVDQRLTYDDADQLVQTDPRLMGLFMIGEGLRRQRGKEGAYFLPLPEVLVRVDEWGEVFVKRVDRDGPSREMVAETAILCNQLMARYMEENQHPAIYRVQAPPHEPIEEGDPSNLFLHFRQRRLLNRVEISPKPGLHSSLGVRPYTHATSPIRRYLDLVMQRQLGAALAGRELPYNAKQLREVCQMVEPAVRRAMRVRQARQRYWILKWMEARRGKAIPGLVMEYQVRRWQILLTDVMVLTTVPSRPGLSLEPGQRLDVTVEKADAFNDILKISVD